MFPHNFTIAANETMPRDVSGSFVYVDEADGDIKLEAYNGGTRVADVPLSFAREATLPFFTKLYVTDTSGAQNKVRLLVGGETEGYARNGSEITGPLGPGGVVAIEDDQGYSFADVYGRILELVNLTDNTSSNARAPYTSLENCSYFETTSSEVVAVDSANNINGAVIKYACVTGYGSSVSGSGFADVRTGFGGNSNLLHMFLPDVDTISQIETIRDIFVPAGDDVIIEADATGEAWAYVELL